MSSLFLFEVDPEPPSPVCVRLHLSILIPIKLACSLANPIYLFSIPLCFNLLGVEQKTSFIQPQSALQKTADLKKRTKS